MIITAVRLFNIKSFVSEELRFVRGVNVIAGRNGAGKSTVIEAVGLALFDAWPRKFRDGNARTGFIRKGEKEASIEVDVQRGGERFTVRCELVSRKRKGSESIDYERSILDAHGSERANSGGRKKDFQDDIRLHILGEARIDDDRLFRDIIGTEQGGFDEPFTRTESERRDLFEKILGIEDFQTFEKQFYAFVKWQDGQTKELSIRYDERSGIRAEHERAVTMLSERALELTDAEQALAEASRRSAEARAAVDALSGTRDALRNARAEQQRIQEKLNGAAGAAETANMLLAESQRAVGIMRESLADFERHIASGKLLDDLRKDAKQRDEARNKFAEASALYEKNTAQLGERLSGVVKESDSTKTEIEELGKDILLREALIKELLDEFARLDGEHKMIEERAQLAGELRSYVQDVSTTRKALLDQGAITRGLRSTFEALSRRLDDIQLDASFLPALREESEILFARFTAAEQTAEELPALDAMLSEALAMENRLQKQVKEALKEVSGVKERGRNERRQYEEKQKAQSVAVLKLERLEEQARQLTEELSRLSSEWREFSSTMQNLLDQHADVDERISSAESDLLQSRPAYEAYIAAQPAAALLAPREEELRMIEASMEESRAALRELAAVEERLALTFSEDEYAAAKQKYDTATAAEKLAHAEHGRVSALVEEQKGLVAKLRKEHADFLKLETMLAHARTESAFSGDVHQYVVRELAKHVGASIVSALSAFAAELYQRIAPEQGLHLHWDAQSYAVELRDGDRRIRGRELSGGQLMGVSLAVKLALIKWYSQCRIGFLDEPTTHLDKETRRHLADVIEHLEELTGETDPWFDQLFIISHEESFSGAGHRIELERSPDRGSKLMTAE